MNDVDAIQKRPGMYVGDIADGSGLHRMLYEVVDNAVDEALAGYGDRIDVTLNADGSATVRDNGRGIPTDFVRDYGVSAVEVVMTRLSHRLGLERNPEGMRSRLSGVGVAVVNALSDMLEVRIWRDGEEHFVRFHMGEPEAPLAVVGSAEVVDGLWKRGTEITFLPSPDVFANKDFDLSRIERRLRGLSGLGAGATIALSDKRGVETAAVVTVRL